MVFVSGIAKDLDHEEPRGMDASLGGYPWLPRMIDKARSYRAGTLGSYYRYPCPIDKTCLEFLAIDAETFANIAETAENDEAALKALQDYGIEPPERATFDPIKLNEELHKQGS